MITCPTCIAKELTLSFPSLMPAAQRQNWWSSLEIHIYRLYMHACMPFLDKHLATGLVSSYHPQFPYFHCCSRLKTAINYLFWLRCINTNLVMNPSCHHTYNIMGCKWEGNKTTKIIGQYLYFLITSI